MFLNCDKVHKTYLFTVLGGEWLEVAWRAFYWENSETLPEDSSIRAELGLRLKSKFMKQEFSSICPECDADEENMCYMGEIENN